MTAITSWLSTMVKDDEGQGLAEYALILALIAIIAIGALVFLGGQIAAILSHRRALSATSSSASP